MANIDRKAIEDIFQETIVQFEKMEPTELDGFEGATLDAIYKIGKALMQWKFQQWNTELRKEQCSECSGKLENRCRSTQIATWVADMHYDRYRSNCTSCGKVEYPLDTALGLQPRQQFSSSVQELAALFGASWKYQELEPRGNTRKWNTWCRRFCDDGVLVMRQSLTRP